ncbi:MAG: hypothetical protein PF542_02230 [Nanoarchaeota archaeon]|jgi:hypothetical protein|nr:hypothetical protein [Nanoarchaeota archaeon]
MEKNVNKKNKRIVGSYFVFGIALVVLLAAAIVPMASSGAAQNVTVSTSLEVGAVFPEILNISVNDGVPVVLTPNATKTVLCQALIQDWNNDSDIVLINATLFDVSLATWDSADDNNTHYTNASCIKQNDTTDLFGKSEDEWHAIANCTFEVQYYANPGNWNCSVYIEDATARSNMEIDEGSINTLLAIGLQDSIDYGIVNSTEVSDEQLVNVSNVGNTQLNLTLNGYSNLGAGPNDGHAMNCSKGSYKFIDIEYEKFNLTDTNPGILSLSEFEAAHVNLTSSLNPAVMEFNLDYRQNDGFNEAVKPTYWRIYVPKGLAGTCEGNIEFGGRVAPSN